ncbi:hypothetical protein HN873_012632, partial [Arachis hypogaea]
IQAILSVEKQLQQLNIREEENNNLRSNLLSRLILTASSDSVIANATKMLSSLNKESADQGDLKNLIIASEAQFPEVTRAWKAFQMEEEQLNSLIGLYRKRLGMRNLEFMSVSGITHLIEAMQLLQNPEPSMKIQQIQQRSLAFWRKTRRQVCS